MAKIQYILHEDYVEGVTKSGHSFFIDIEDYKLISSISWYCEKNGYMRNKELGYMHRFINETPDGLHTDHINRNKRDNRRSNLRNATPKENENNKPNRANGIRRTKNNKYEAYYHVDRKYVHVGTFETHEEAMKAREKAMQ